MADDIRTCRDLDERLTPYVDEAADVAARRAVETHLDACPPCRGHAEAERSARRLVAEHRDALCGSAPDALRARCGALRASRPAPPPRASLVRRWAPLSLAASLVLAVAGVFVFGLNDRVQALAASLTVDHVKCFALSGGRAHVDAPDAEQRWEHTQGWTIVVPGTAPAEELKLIDVRRCFSSDGRTAHMMFTWRGAPLSLYVLPGEAETVPGDRIIDKMGHAAVIWCANRRTYALVADGRPQDLTHIVEYMKVHAR